MPDYFLVFSLRADLAFILVCVLVLGLARGVQNRTGDLNDNIIVVYDSHNYDAETETQVLGSFAVSMSGPKSYHLTVALES